MRFIVPVGFALFFFVIFFFVCFCKEMLKKTFDNIFSRNKQKQRLPPCSLLPAVAGDRCILPSTRLTTSQPKRLCSSMYPSTPASDSSLQAANAAGG